jgi:hypothetical protein|tara:strand:+ start:300 stop:929 length:630 start_codon:yes stop_codon:yes gene_type:complete
MLFYSCSWVSDTWEKRPDWVMPDDKSSETIEFNNQELFSGFSSNISSGKLEKKLEEKNIDYSESTDSKKDLKIYIVKGSLIDTKSAFSYKQIESNIDFFDGNFLSSRIFIDALNQTNLDEIVSSIYAFLVEFYSEPTSESSIYSYDTYEWTNGDIEVFLSIDRDSKVLILSEVNSSLEKSRRFKEFKDKFIDEYQTYEEEMRYGKRRRR